MIKLEKLYIFLTEEHPIMNNSENKELLEGTANNLKVSAKKFTFMSHVTYQGKSVILILKNINCLIFYEFPYNFQGL